MSIYQVRTFGEILATIREEMQFSSSDTTKLNRIKRDVNAILNEIAAEKNWWWLQGSVSLQLPAYIHAGTATVTAGESGVTLSIAPVASMKNYWFAVDGFQEIYRVESHTEGALTLKLDGLFAGSTSSTATYKLWKDRIPLPTDCKETTSVYHEYFSTNLDAKGRQEFRRITALNPRAEGKPAYYYTGDFYDPSQTSTITSLPAVTTRASTGPVKTMVFASGLPTSITSAWAAGDPIRLRIQGAGDPSYNGDVLVSTVTQTNVANDTLIYTGKGELQESATSDSSISVTQLDQEAEYDRYRELFLYPCLNTSRVLIHVDYIKQVLPLNNDSDEPTIPLEDRMVLVYGALSRAWSRDRNPDEAARNLGMYKNKLAKMAGKLQDSQESPRFAVNREYLRSKRNISMRGGLNGFAPPLSGSGSGAGSVVTGTANSAAIFNSLGELVAAPAVSDSELAYLDGATSNIQDQIDALSNPPLTNAHILVGNASNVGTDVAVSGDLTMANTGAATVVTVGGSTAANVHTGEALANAATDANTVSTIVKRDGSGNFTAGTVTATVTGTASGNLQATANNHGVLLSGAANTAAVLAPDASTTKVLVSGGASSNPAWGTVALGSAVSGTLPKANGGTAQDNSSLTFPSTGTVQATTPNNHGVLVSGAGATATVVAPDASTVKALISGGASADPAWGNLGPTAGGTGLTTYTTGDVPYASATNTLAKLGIGSSGQFLKVSSGIPNWGPGASGINYLSANPDAEADTAGWATYADAAGTSPVDGTGGSPNSTWTRTTSSPLRGTGSFLFTKSSGASRQGEGVSYAFTLDSADQAKPIAIGFDYAIASGTYVDGDMSVWLYDVTNAVVIQPAPYTILSATAGLSQKWMGYFQTSAASTSYRLCIHVGVSTNSANTIKFDNFNVGPTYQSYGAVQTDPVAYTPTFTGLGTVTNVAVTSWRKGAFLEGYAKFTTGTCTAVQAQMTLGYNGVNGGVTISSSAGLASGTNIAGYGTYGSVNGSNLIPLATPANAYLTFGIAATGGAGLTSANGSTAFVNTTDHAFFFRVPVAGWSSNVQVSSDADTRVVAFRRTNTAGTTLTKSAANTIPFATADYDTHGAWATDTYTVAVPGQYVVKSGLTIAAGATWGSGDAIVMSVLKNGSTHTAGQQFVFFGTQAAAVSSSVTATVNAVAGDTIKINCQPTKAAAGNVTLDTSAGYNWVTIEKVSGPAQIAASEKVRVKYINTAGTSITSSSATVPFATKIYDSHGAFNVATANTFVAPRADTYRVTAKLTLQAVSNSTAQQFQLYTLVTSGPEALTAQKQYLDIRWGEGVSHSRMVSGTTTYQLNQGDTIAIQADNANTIGLDTTAYLNVITIESQGGI